MITLRPYQHEALDGGRGFPGIVGALASHRSTLLVAATGTGKTTIFAETCRRFVAELAAALDLAPRVLVIAHRSELIQQAAARIRAQTGLVVGIEQAEQRVSPLFMPDVVVATVQSLQGARLRGFAPDAFGLVIVDEAHHATADSYRAILEHFAGARVLGVTATPDRGDGEALRGVFESVAYVYEIRDAIEQGYLCPIMQQAVQIDGLDFSRCRTTAGDLNEGDLERELMREAHVLAVARATFDRAEARPTMLFGVTVAHAEALAARLNDFRPGCARALSGRTEDDERAEALRAFKAGAFQFLANCALFTEGFDEPQIACVAIARPTKSRAFYTQMAGRGTRICDGKRNLLLLDFQGNAGRHSLISPLDILDGNGDAEAKRRAEKKCRQRPDLDILTALDEAAAELAEERRRAVLAAMVQHRATTIDPFAMVQAFLGIRPAPGRWGGAPPAPEDLRFLAERAKGLDVKGLDGGQVAAVAKAVRERNSSGRSTWNQARVLMRAGLDAEVSFQEASAAMAQLSAAGWKPTGAIRAAWAAHEAHKTAVAELGRASAPEVRAHLTAKVERLARERRMAFAAIGTSEPRQRSQLALGATS